MERKKITIPNKPDTAYLEKLSDLHKAMGDYTRMKILWKLMGGEICVGDLAKEIGIRSGKTYSMFWKMNILSGSWRRLMPIFWSNKQGRSPLLGLRLD